jgi:phenylalanyl-tRNA synthetase alpha chain
VDPRSRRESRTFRILYRSMTRTVSNAEINAIQEEINARLAAQLGVVIR